MRCVTLFALFATFGVAQPNEPFKPRPPAGVDEALRARAQEFFDLHIQGKFRKAEELVAEDTKEFFYSGNKPRYLSCEFIRIDYSDNFTKANVLMDCEQYVMMPGFANSPMKIPTPSAWKLENGKWCWYVDQDALRNTPWGRMEPGPFPAKGGAAPHPLPIIPTSPDFVYKQVRLDKDAVRLKAGESAEVTISNGAPGPMTLSLQTTVPGVHAKMEPSTVAAGGKAVISLRAGEEAKSGVLKVLVEQTMQVLPIQVTVVAGAAPHGLPIVPNPPDSVIKPPDSVGKKVTLGKDAVRLKAGESSEVTISNGAPGPMTLSLQTTVPGVHAKMEPATVAAGGKAVLTLHAGKKAKSGVLKVLVEQTMQVLPIQVTVVQ